MATGAVPAARTTARAPAMGVVGGRTGARGRNGGDRGGWGLACALAVRAQGWEDWTRARAAPSSKAPSTLPAPLLLVGASARGCGGLWRVGASCGRKVGKCGENAPVARVRPVSRPRPHAFPHPAPCSICVGLCGNAGRRAGYPPWRPGRAVTRDGSWAVAEIVGASYPFLWGARGAVSCPRSRTRSTHPLHPQM